LDHRIDEEKPNHTSPPPVVNWRNPRPLADIGTWIKRQLRRADLDPGKEPQHEVLSGRHFHRSLAADRWRLVSARPSLLPI